LYGAAEDRSVKWGWLFPALWCGLILIASSIPVITTPRGLFAPDKLIHFAEYAVLATFMATSLAEQVPWPPLMRVVGTVGACLIFGAVDETYQYSMSGRAADIYDLVSDIAGAMIAGLAVLIVGRIRKGRS